MYLARVSMRAMSVRVLLTATLCLTSFAPRLSLAQTAPASCSVSHEPAAVTPARLFVELDRTAGTLHRVQLDTGVDKSSLALFANPVALAYWPAVDLLVTAHGAPSRLAVLPTHGRAAEATFAQLSGPPCGMAVAGDYLVVCVDRTTWQVYDGAGDLVDSQTIDELASPDIVLTLPDGTTTTIALASWDALVFEPESRTLFATRSNPQARRALRVPLGADGSLGTVDSVPGLPPPKLLPGDDALALSSDGASLISSDGLRLDSESLAVQLPPVAPDHDVLRIGDATFAIGKVTCDFAALPASTDPNAIVGQTAPSGALRVAEWPGHARLLIGSGSSLVVRKLGLGGNDLDLDSVPDRADFFPLEPVAGKDSDRDGVPDASDQLPRDRSGWKDGDHDGVADNLDAFPNDPSESNDADGDGVGDHADFDPNDPSESADTDGDRVGDHADALPEDPLETADSDGDGVGDHGDAFPNDPNESSDFDGDGTGDVADGAQRFGDANLHYDLALQQVAKRKGDPSNALLESGELVLIGADRFALCRETCISGAIELAGASQRKFKLTPGIGSLSRLAAEFRAATGAGVVARDLAGTRITLTANRDFTQLKLALHISYRGVGHPDRKPVGALALRGKGELQANAP
jgi:hypothetical protein